MLTGRDYVRNKVRERDSFTCRDCGFIRTPSDVLKVNRKFKSKLKSLDVHHLNGECGKRSRGYDRASEIDNLITLCHKCHYNRHDLSELGKSAKGRRLNVL